MLIYVLEGFDYLLSHPELGVRVVNCSFSAETVTTRTIRSTWRPRMLTDGGINVVVSAGNTGSGMHTLNPYAVAPWVVSVGATDTQAKLAGFRHVETLAACCFTPRW